MIKGQRIASVEWIRIFAAVGVIIYHFESLYFGEQVYFSKVAVVVDFFFMLSGFLLMRGVLKKEGDLSVGSSLTDSFQFVFKKAKSFYPFYILAFAMTFVLTTIIANMSDVEEILTRLFHFKWEALLLQMAGFNPSPAFNADYLVGSAWYLSAMLVAMLPVYYMATHHKNAYVKVIAPISAIFIYCYIMQEYGTIDVGNEMVGVVMLGTLRAFAGLGVGCMCYAVYVKVRDLKWKQSITVGVSIIEALCFLSLPALIILQKYILAEDVLFWLVIFAILIILCFADKTPIARMLNRHGSKIGVYLGSLSLYIYIFHWFFVLVFVNYIPGLNYWAGLMLFSLCVFLFSAIVMFIMNKIRSREHAKIVGKMLR